MVFSSPLTLSPAFPLLSWKEWRTLQEGLALFLTCDRLQRVPRLVGIIMRTAFSVDCCRLRHAAGESAADSRASRSSGFFRSTQRRPPTRCGQQPTLVPEVRGAPTSIDGATAPAAALRRWEFANVQRSLDALYVSRYEQPTVTPPIECPPTVRREMGGKYLVDDLWGCNRTFLRTDER